MKAYAPEKSEKYRDVMLYSPSKNIFRFPVTKHTAKSAEKRLKVGDSHVARARRHIQLEARSLRRFSYQKTKVASER